MGGFRSKPTGTLESQYAAKLEDSLGFWRHSPGEIYSAFSRFIVNGTLDRRAIKRIEMYLGLKSLDDLVNLISPDPTISRVPAEHLVVLAVLLASGSSLEKGELLWDLFDKDATGELTKINLGSLFGSLVNAACSFAANAIKPNAEFSVNRLNKWRDDLKARTNKGRDTLLDSFIGDRPTMKREEFLNAAKTKLSFTAPFIREYIEKVVYVAFSASSAFANFKKSAA